VLEYLRAVPEHTVRRLHQNVMLARHRVQYSPFGNTPGGDAIDAMVNHVAASLREVRSSASASLPPSAARDVVATYICEPCQPLLFDTPINCSATWARAAMETAETETDAQASPATPVAPAARSSHGRGHASSDRADATRAGPAAAASTDMDRLLARASRLSHSSLLELVALQARASSDALHAASSFVAAHAATSAARSKAPNAAA
jgi:hypothetical protein